jgi:hypothetical protein
MEPALRQDLSGVRVHDGAAAAALASSLNARAFTYGDQVVFGAGEHRPGTPRGDAMLAHELAHVVQQRSGAAPEPVAGAARAEPALERDADRAAAGVTVGLWGKVLGNLGERIGPRPSLTTGLRLQRCDGPGLSDDEKLAIWKQSIEEQHSEDLEEQEETVEGQIRALELSASTTRRKAIDASLAPPAVIKAWDDALRLIFAVGPTLSQTGTLEPANRDPLVAALEAFYREFRAVVAPKDYSEKLGGFRGASVTITKNPFLSEGALKGERFPLMQADPVGILERARTASTRAEWLVVFADFRRVSVAMDRFIADEMNAVAKKEQAATMGASEKTADAAVAALETAMQNGAPADLERKEARLALYDFSAKLRRAVAINDYKYTPKAVRSTSPYITNDYYSESAKEGFERSLAYADSDDQWKWVIKSYQGLKTAKEKFIANPAAKTRSDEGERLVYQSNVVQGVYSLLEKHPQSKRVRTIFYPEEESERIEDEDFTAQGYPIELYLYYEGASWYLVDFTNPDQVKTNDEKGSETDVPVKALFGYLNSRHRFPRGKLYWWMPDGQEWSLRTEAKWTVADWLSAIGITAAVIGLALATGGASVTATAFFVASGIAGAGAALWTMLEKSEQGLLTTADVAVGVSSIVAELSSAATAGMGKLVFSSAGKTGTLAKLAVLADRFYIPTVKITAAANTVSLIAIGAKELAQLEAIDRGKGSDADKQLAKERVVNQLLLMGGITILAMKGQLADFKGGRNLYFDPSFTEKGIARALLKDEELLQKAASVGVKEDAAALLGRTDLSEDLMLRLRAEVSGAVSAGKRDPAALKKSLAALRAATGAEAVETALADLRKLNQQSYEKMLELFKQPEIAALLKKRPELRTGLEQNPRLIDLIANDDTVRNVLIKRPEVMESLLKHPEAVEIVETAIAKAAAAKAAGTPPPAAAKLTTQLSQAQLDVSRRVGGAVKGKAVQPGFDASKIGNKKSTETYLDDLYKQAEAAQTELTTISEKIATGSKGQAFSRPEPKLRARSMDKINSLYKGDASQLTDLAGSKIIYQTLDDLYQGLGRVEKDLGGKIVSFEDRFIKPMESGYRDIQMSLKMSNGHVAEFRLHLASIEVVSEMEHAAYELRRAIRPVAEEAGRKGLSPAEGALEQALIAESQALYEAALKKGMKTP